MRSEVRKPYYTDRLPQKVVNSKREKDSKTKKQCTMKEEKQVYGRAARLRAEADGTGHTEIVGEPKTRDCEADALPLNE